MQENLLVISELATIIDHLLKQCVWKVTIENLLCHLRIRKCYILNKAFGILQDMREVLQVYHNYWSVTKTKFLKAYKVCAKFSVSGQLHDNPDWSVRTNANQLDDVAVIELLHYVWRKLIKIILNYNYESLNNVFKLRSAWLKNKIHDRKINLMANYHLVVRM